MAAMCGSVLFLNSPVTTLAAAGPAAVVQADEQRPLPRRRGVADIDTQQTSPKTVTVVDESEQPISDATVSVGWWEDADGDMLYHLLRRPPVTDAAGQVTIDVPRGAVRVLLTVQAPGFVRFGRQVSLNGEPRVRLSPGRIVMVRALDTTGTALPEANPILEDSRVFGREFKSLEPGLFYLTDADPDRRWLRVVARSGEQGPLLFSSLIDVYDEQLADDQGIITAVLRPGVRLEGRLDDSVPRPVGEGYVELYLKEGSGSQIPVRGGWTWEDFAKVKPDGTFVFESLPPGGHVQLFALVNGFQSTRPSAEQLRDYLRQHNAGDAELVEQAVQRPSIWPVLFPLNQAVVSVTVPCEPTAAADIRVVDPAGNPLAEAEIRFNPNGYFLGGNLFIPGTGFSDSARVAADLKQELSQARRDWCQRSFNRVLTAADGWARIRNLPGRGRESYHVEADGFVMPAHPTSTDTVSPARYAVIEYEPGASIRRTMTLERELPRHERELMVVSADGTPLADISATVVEMAFADDPELRHFWATQRFGAVVSETTGADGRLLLRLPTEVQQQQVQSVTLQLKGIIPQGRTGRKTTADIDGSVNDEITVPALSDGKVLRLTVSADPPADARGFRDVVVDYLDPLQVVTADSREVLQQLVEEPSLLLLRSLLDRAEFTDAEPIAFAAERNLSSRNSADRSPVCRIVTDRGDRVVVLCDVRPQGAEWQAKPEGRFPPEAAFVFDATDGTLLAMLGGRASSDGHYQNVMLYNMGGTDDYFCDVSASESNPPFPQRTQRFRIGHEQTSALTMLHDLNSTSWTGTSEPADPPAEFGRLTFAFNGKDPDRYAAGLTRDGQLVPRSLYWDGSRNRFLGPVTQSYDQQPLYQVVVEDSAEFQPLDVRPGQIVVGGGRREYRNWHLWDVVIPRDPSFSEPANLQLALTDGTDSTETAAAEILFETKLAQAELHKLQLQIDPEDPTTVKLLVDRQPVQEATLISLPHPVLDDGRGESDQPVFISQPAPLQILRRRLQAQPKKMLVLRIVQPESN